MMEKQVRTRELPTSQEVEAELNRELGKRRVHMLMRCALYVLVTAAVVAFFLFSTVIPGRTLS